jgi:hypothetical protein
MENIACEQLPLPCGSAQEKKKDRKKEEIKCILQNESPLKVMWNSWLLLLSHNP